MSVVRIVLVLLSIIGIILAVLLAVFFLALFVPVRYRAYGRKKEDVYAKGTVSWLLHFVHASVVYEEGRVGITFRIFGIPVGKKEMGATPEEEEAWEDEKPPEVIAMERRPAPDRESENLDKSRTAKERETEGKIREEKTEEKIKRKPKVKKETGAKGEARTEKEKPIEKIRRLVEQLKEFWKENKAAVETIFKKITFALKQLLPRKLVCSIWFGTGDPCSTGQITGLLAVLYGLYGENVNIYPDFTQAVFMGEVLVEGRIRLFTFVRICITLLLDKKVRRLLRNIKNLKEGL